MNTPSTDEPAVAILLLQERLAFLRNAPHLAYPLPILMVSQHRGAAHEVLQGPKCAAPTRSENCAPCIAALMCCLAVRSLLCAALLPMVGGAVLLGRPQGKRGMSPCMQLTVLLVRLTDNRCFIMHCNGSTVCFLCQHHTKSKCNDDACRECPQAYDVVAGSGNLVVSKYMNPTESAAHLPTLAAENPVSKKSLKGAVSLCGTYGGKCITAAPQPGVHACKWEG